MLDSLFEAVARVPERAWVGLGVGGITLVAGISVLYTELRAVFTEHRSIAYDPDEPPEVTVLRRILAWMFVVTMFFIAAVFLYVGSIGVRRCAIMQDPSWKC